jgi:type IV pilus assembly protein PilA
VLRKKDDEGFTLIELLVVVVIIGVLVAIAVPVYLNYRKGAADKSAQSDVRGAVSAVEHFYADNHSTFPDTNKSLSGDLALTATSQGSSTATLSDKSQLGYVKALDGQSYMICGTNSGGSGKYYLYESTAGGSVHSVTGTLSLDTCAAA